MRKEDILKQYYKVFDEGGQLRGDFKKEDCRSLIIMLEEYYKDTIYSTLNFGDLAKGRVNMPTINYVVLECSLEKQVNV